MPQTKEINGMTLTLERFVNHGPILAEEGDNKDFVETICTGSINKGPLLYYLCDIGMVPVDKGFATLKQLYKVHGVNLEGAEIVTDKALLEEIQSKVDNRDKVKEGDRVAGYWHGDSRWYIFTANKTKYDGVELSEHEVGLGFWTEDSLFDIGYAQHIVKLSN